MSSGDLRRAGEALGDLLRGTIKDGIVGAQGALGHAFKLELAQRRNVVFPTSYGDRRDTERPRNRRFRAVPRDNLAHVHNRNARQTSARCQIY